METRVSKLLGTKYPVIQGGMAWVAEYHLAAAVSNAGGLGIIDRKSTRLNSSHPLSSRMPSSA